MGWKDSSTAWLSLGFSLLASERAQSRQARSWASWQAIYAVGCQQQSCGQMSSVSWKDWWWWARDRDRQGRGDSGRGGRKREPGGTVRRSGSCAPQGGPWPGGVIFYCSRKYFNIQTFYSCPSLTKISEVHFRPLGFAKKRGVFASPFREVKSTYTLHGRSTSDIIFVKTLQPV